MSDYAVFFDKDNVTYRLPVNPEKITRSIVQANEKYDILKLGKIVIPTHMELKEYSFDVELPGTPLHYVETPNEFKGPFHYFSAIRRWRLSKEPVRFIASNNGEDEINILVLIEDMQVEERAGEEGDKYASFKLLEYKEFGKKTVIIKAKNTNTNTKTATKKTEKKKPPSSPKNKGTHVVVRGDTLWAISKKYYGAGNWANVNKIVAANKIIKNPNLIYPGQKFVIPL